MIIQISVSTYLIICWSLEQSALIVWSKHLIVYSKIINITFYTNPSSNWKRFICQKTFHFFYICHHFMKWVLGEKENDFYYKNNKKKIKNEQGQQVTSVHVKNYYTPKCNKVVIILNWKKQKGINKLFLINSLHHLKVALSHVQLELPCEREGSCPVIFTYWWLLWEWLHGQDCSLFA